MSTLPMQELQAALYQVMSTNAALMAQAQGIYDHVPTGAQFPYIVFDDVSADSWNILHPSAHVVRFSLDVYGRKGGQKELLQLASLVCDVLHRKPLMASGWEVSLVEVTYVDSDRLNDGLTRRVQMLITIWAKEL